MPLIDATPDAAMILLVEGNWPMVVSDPLAATNRRDQGAHMTYRDLH